MNNLFSDIQTFIQVMAAFNFAFATSNKFNHLLYEKVVFSIKKVKRQLITFKSKVNVSKESVEGAYKSENEATRNIEDLRDIKTQLNLFEQENLKIETKLNQIISNVSRQNFFMLICSYTGPYCLFILLYDGFNFFNYEQLFVFNILSLVFFIVLFIFEILGQISINQNEELVVFKSRVINYKNFLVFFIIFSFISYFGIEALHYLGFYCPIDIEFWVKITTVFLCSVHFIWYFLLSIYNSLSISRKTENNIHGLTSAFDNFQTQNIQPAIFIANKLKKYNKIQQDK